MEVTLWSEKYRPSTISECILPKRLKNLFSQYVEKRDFVNLLLAGKPGTGKTTVAKALLEEIGADYVVYNGSLNVDKDTLRHEIATYASSYSVLDESLSRKFVILDEADYLSTSHVQPALRNFMEEFADNTGFILTCNHRNRIIEALHSRCTVIDFRIDRGERKGLAKEQLKRLEFILQAEGVPVEDEGVLVGLVARYFPDLRRMINELQAYSASGSIDTGILRTGDLNVRKLLEMIKGRHFTQMRQWVSDNWDIEAPDLFKAIYENAGDFMEAPDMALLVLILAKYQYQAAFAADPAINTLAALVDIMKECSFKE